MNARAMFAANVSKDKNEVAADANPISKKAVIGDRRPPRNKP